MITAKFQFKWEGRKITQRLRAEIARATHQGAIRIQRTAKDPILNKPGKAMMGLSGINRGTVAARRSAGLKRLKGARTLTFKRKGILRTANYVYWYGEPLHRWVQASAPGTPPHKQTGTLQRSIAVQISQDKLSAKVGPGQGLVYARVQELGGKTRRGVLPPRPYMKPAFQTELQSIYEGYKAAVERAMKK